MGAGQSFQWATQFPDFMDICVPFCGSARTSLHNQVFLEGVKSALLAAKHLSSAGSCEGRVETKGSEVRKWSEEERTVGLKAFGRGYAGWGFSQTFYREKLHETVYGAKNLEEFMVNFVSLLQHELMMFANSPSGRRGLCPKIRRTYWSCSRRGNPAM